MQTGPIWLVGMMGSGKSAVGPALARLLGREFIDSDRRVEQKAGCSIAHIFARQGEPAFRALERRVIDEAAGGEAVVALGGGAIAQPGAPEKLAKSGVVVYLRAEVETLLARVGRAESRPLLAGLEPEEQRARIEQMLRERERAYGTASIVVETDGMQVDEVAQVIADEIEARAK
jgi:shikimate kinase